MSTRRSNGLISKPRTLRGWVFGCVVFALALFLGSTGPVMSRDSAQDKKPKDRQQSANDDETVRLHSDLVVVNLTVTDASGKYARGLSQKDFTVLEDEARQTVSSFAAEEAAFAAVILLDMSGSMGYKFGLARAAAASFVDHIRENDQVAVYGFNNKIRQFQDFSDVRDISDYIWDAKAEDQTRLYDCADEAITALEKRPETRRAMLLISDGWDSRSHQASFDSVMKRALRLGIVIYAVDLIEETARMGTGSGMLEMRRGQNEMKEFAAQTGGRYVHSPQGDKLEEAFGNIVDELRNQYTLTYYPTSPKRDGRWRKLSINVSRDGLTTRSRKGYWAPRS